MSVILPLEYGKIVEQHALAFNSISYQARLKIRELLDSKLSFITYSTVEKYCRKAVRTGAWRNLSYVSRALLRAIRHIPFVKSSVLRSILLDIFVDIELYTTWGKAVFYGIIVALKNKLHEALENVRRLITLGISYMNTPLPWRILD